MKDVQNYASTIFQSNDTVDKRLIQVYQQQRKSKDTARQKKENLVEKTQVKSIEKEEAQSELAIEPSQNELALLAKVLGGELAADTQRDLLDQPGSSQLLQVVEIPEKKPYRTPQR